MFNRHDSLSRKKTDKSSDLWLTHLKSINSGEAQSYWKFKSRNYFISFHGLRESISGIRVLRVRERKLNIGGQSVGIVL